MGQRVAKPQDKIIVQLRIHGNRSSHSQGERTVCYYSGRKAEGGCAISQTSALI